MMPESRSLLDELDKREWFGSVGETIEDISVKQVQSWDDAFRYCKAVHYEGTAHTEALNMLSERLHQAHNERYNRSWNPMVMEITAHVTPIVQRHIEPIVRQFNPPPEFEFSVIDDLRGACMELEYIDIIPPIFFTKAVEWYFKGHFPCGWEGHYRHGGKLVVF